MTNKDILNAISNMSVKEVVELIKSMEDEFGVSAAAMVAPAAAADAGAAVEEKTEFDVKMTELGANKVSVIKAIRSITSLGLKEAKEMAEKAPVVIKEAVSKAEAEDLVKLITEAGAKAEIV
jgi:large subunit ribosomal protein L7/L12